MPKYNHKKIEKKWQKQWLTDKPFAANDDSKKEKQYILVEFPYPSGEGLHVGHVRSYTALDVMARMKRLQNFNVLYPMGWDAFGLPAENYAIKTGIHPTKVTKTNINHYRDQMQSLGISFDWDRQVDTTDPAYYKWTQWIFLQLYKKDLAYKKKMPINWCPSCKIGLANEEVVNGNCERCGTASHRKDMEQWMLKITQYADRLIEDLETVDYLEKIKSSQINWIGRSSGADVTFKVKDSTSDVTVYTTRPDTLFGATYIVLSPENELVNSIATDNHKTEIAKYQETARKKSDLERTELQKDKTGVFTGAYAINPVNGEEIPIWIADYVLATYGTGAIMAVPAHDERDFEFATKYDLPIREVLVKNFGGYDKKAERRDGVAAVVKKNDKVLILYNKKYDCYRLPSGGYEDGETAEETISREIVEESGYNDFEFKGSLGTIESNFYLVDKKKQRQKFHKGFHVELNSDAKTDTAFEDHKDYEENWFGRDEAIEKLIPYGGGEEEFVRRAFDNSLMCFSGDGTVINSDFLDGMETFEALQAMVQWLEKNKVGKATKQYKLRDWVFSRQHYWGEPIPLVYCDKCGTVPLPEDQLPLELPLVEKYEPTDNGESPLAAITEWVNTTCPTCNGPAKRETDTMPNWAGSSWYFLRYCDPKNNESFADMDKMKYWMQVDLYNGGMEHTTLHLLYSRFWNKVLYDIGVVPFNEPYKRRVSHGMILGPDGEKMSKSRGNVINPDGIVEEFGADVLRSYEMFIGPYDQSASWDVGGIKGIRRFLEKNWNFENFTDKDNPEVVSLLHQTIKKITEDVDQMRFNTAVSTLMIFLNKIIEIGCTKAVFTEYLIMLSLFMPHLVEELTEYHKFDKNISDSTWPKFNASLILQESVELPIQINGKLRDKITVSPNITEDEVNKLVRESTIVQKWLDGKEPRKVIYVKGRMVSIVI